MMRQCDHLNQIRGIIWLPWHSIPLARVKHNVTVSPRSKPRTDVSLPGQPPHLFFSPCDCERATHLLEQISTHTTYTHRRIWFGWILHDAVLKCSGSRVVGHVQEATVCLLDQMMGFIMFISIILSHVSDRENVFWVVFHRQAGRQAAPYM